MTRDELIMQFYDGELAEPEASQARELLANDPEARELLLRLELTSSALESALLAHPAPPNFTDTIMARVTEACAPAIAVPASSPRRSVVPRLAERRSKRALAWVSAGLALAAAVAITITRPQFGSLAKQDRNTAAPAGAISAREPDAPQQSIAIERIDFGEDPGAIFLVPGESERTVVVWTMDVDDADNGPEEVEL
jgi:anti-sigma factor RsiW